MGKINKYLVIIILLLVSCKSTKTTKDNDLDVFKTEIDKSTKVIELDRVEFSFDEITIVSANPNKETTITDSKGVTKTFKNIKSVTIKRQKESKETRKEDEKKDVDKVLIDKSKIKETTESISDAVQYKWILISIASIVLFILIGYLVFKFKR